MDIVSSIQLQISEVHDLKAKIRWQNSFNQTDIIFHDVSLIHHTVLAVTVLLSETGATHSRICYSLPLLAMGGLRPQYVPSNTCRGTSCLFVLLIFTCHRTPSPGGRKTHKG